MKCSYCNMQAIAWEPAVRRQYCNNHYAWFIERKVEKTIEKYKLLQGVRKLVIAVSGGKDSVALLRILHKLYDGKIKLLGVTIDLGIDQYSREASMIALKHYKELSIDYICVDLKEEYGFTISYIKMNKRVLRLHRSICSLCGTVKRYVLNKIASEENADAIATGHNMNDLLYQIIASMISGSREDLGKALLKTPSRNGLVSRIKPLAFLSDKQTLLYNMAIDSVFFWKSCPYAEQGTLKRDVLDALDSIEHKHPGFKESLLVNFLKLVESTKQATTGIVYKCKRCGMPTNKPDICAFCKLRETLLERIKT